MLIPENLIFPFVRCCFPTKKVDKYDEKELEKMISTENKDDVNHNYQGKERVLSPDSPKWLYESPQRKPYESQ